MNIEIKGINTAYKESGQGKVILILHGWACNKEMFDFIHEKYNKCFRVISIDLPGFGMTQEPKQAYNTRDYALFIDEFMKKLKIDRPVVIGHSFGGRILIELSTIRKFDKMILTGSAGLVAKKSFSYYIKVYFYKMSKFVYQHTPLKKIYPNWLEEKRQKVASEDYKNASEIMRKTLVKVVNEDLRDRLGGIDCPTILLWGTNDTATPIADAKIMEAMIPDAALIELKGGSHYAFLEQKTYVLKIIDAFIN